MIECHDAIRLRYRKTKDLVSTQGNISTEAKNINYTQCYTTDVKARRNKDIRYEKYEC